MSEVNFSPRTFRGGLLSLSLSHFGERSAEQRDRMKTVPAAKLWASCCPTLAMHGLAAAAAATGILIGLPATEFCG